MAERVGFEPTVPVRVQRFSRPSDSTTLAPLRESLILMVYSEKYQVEALFSLKNAVMISLHSAARTPDVISRR
jgi:hypothetical protein